jgi:hypothetical protein
MIRVLGIELRRSAAPGTALALAVVGVLVLFFAAGIVFADGWMQLAMTQRLYLALLWPLALAAGGWQARREHRSRVAELFAGTPRPRAQRVLPTLGAMALAVTAGYLVVGAAGAGWIAGTARYWPPAALAVTAVGVLALIAAVWLGLALGRLLPSPATAPLLGVAGLGLLLAIPWLTRPRGWLALVFSPITEMNLPGAYATVPGRVSLAQACWALGLTLAAVTLLAAGGWRLRVAALIPVLLGAAVAVTVMPHRNRMVLDAVDARARQLVCTADTPRVCVSRVHSGLLAEVVPPARAGLATLAALPGAPAEVHEDTTVYRPDRLPPARTDVVLLTVAAAANGHFATTGAEAAVVAAAFDGPPTCERGTDPADRLAAAAWLTGRAPVSTPTASGTPFAGPGDATVEAATERWEQLRRLPRGEATSRVEALRRAALACAAGEGMLTGTSP